MNVDVVDLELEDLVVVAVVDLDEAVDHLLNEEDLEGLDEDPHLRSDKEPLSRVRCDFYSGCFSFSFLVKERKKVGGLEGDAYCRKDTLATVDGGLVDEEGDVTVESEAQTPDCCGVT